MSETTITQNCDTSAPLAKPSIEPAIDPGANETAIEELLGVVTWTLSRESDAVDTIRRLSYRIDSESELAHKARDYAARLQQLIARLKTALPRASSSAGGEAPLGGDLSNSLIQSLDREHATTTLILFLLQHAETTSHILQSAGDKLNSKSAEMLWRKAERERRKIAEWITQQEQQSKAAAERMRNQPLKPQQSRNARVCAPQNQLVIWRNASN